MTSSPADLSCRGTIAVHMAAGLLAMFTIGVCVLATIGPSAPHRAMEIVPVEESACLSSGDPQEARRSDQILSEAPALDAHEDGASWQRWAIDNDDPAGVDGDSRPAVIRWLIQEVRRLQTDRSYEAALEVTELILAVDSENPTALLLRDVLEDLSHFGVLDYAPVYRSWRPE